MALSDTQAGRVGEMLFAVYALVTSEGLLEVYPATADDDHRDDVVGRKDRPGTCYVQVKSCHEIDAQGRVTARADYPADGIPEHSAFLYVVQKVSGVAIDAAWIVPSADFNRLAYRSTLPNGHVRLAFRCRADRDDAATPFRVAPTHLGSELLRRLEEVGEIRPIGCALSASFRIHRR